MTDDQITYLRRKALKLRQIAVGRAPDISALLLDLAEEFELKADDIEAAARSRITC